MKLPTKTDEWQEKLSKTLVFVCATILVLLPFHAFLTVWGASLVGHYTLLRLWKEILLLGLLFGGALYIGLRLRQPAGLMALRRAIRRPLVVAVSAYCLLMVVCGLVGLGAGAVTAKALAYGWLLDARFLAFFGIVWLLCSYNGWIIRHWRQLLLIPAIVVVVFGLLQFTVLPDNFLAHFGYGPFTIDAVQTVDQKAAYHRVQSSLRGANPLGAYLVIIVAALGGLLLRGRRPLYIAGFAAACAVLGMTFSRSAWLGAAAALGYLVWQAVSNAKARKLLVVAAAAGLLVFAAGGYMLRNNDLVQNTLFHTDEHSTAGSSSNQGHFNATAVGVGDIARRPLGTGVGTAGPASAYNIGPGKPGARIAENYFVQVGQEMGLLGLGLFVTINALLGMELWRRQHSLLARVLLASLVGISLINLLSHAWTDDTLAYVWWGLAGAAMALPIVGKAGKTGV